MRSFGLMIFFGLFFIVFLYIVMNFFDKKNEDFSSNIQGNVAAGTVFQKPIHLFILLKT